MNVVVFAAYAINSPHFETDLEIAHKHADEGDHVTILTCGSELDACDPNPFHDLPRCAKCMGRRDAGLKQLPSSVEVEPFYRLTEEDRRELDDLRTQFDTQDELTRLQVGSFDLGYAALYSLISKIRDPDVDLRGNASLLRGFLRAGWIVHRSMCRYLDTHAVDRVYVFNGRFATMRAVLRACQEKAVEYYTHERANDPTRYTLFRNTFCHDRESIRDFIWETWNTASADPDREKIARRWYESRVRGGGNYSVVLGQESSRLPASWDDNNRNITVFLSSEDEYIGISDEWRNPLYESQDAAVRAIIESLRADPRNLHLYIRAHPCLSLVDNTQTRAMAKLTAPFVTVIPPSDPIDTYELMRKSASVLTFGSTTGIEAVYWGIPSILAGIAYYQDFGATHNPATHDELVELLSTDLQPRPIEPALAYGYFWSTFGVPFEYFAADGLYSGHFKGVRIRPSLRALTKVGMLRVLHPQRVIRHLRRMATKRARLLRNRMRRQV